MKLEVFFILSLSYCVSTLDKDSDEGRPYEFGFTIDGQQHRHESKDVNGIVNGEFGFITADGIYHVTVYATDENGNFKILSMRNVRVSGPLDEPGYEFPKKTPSSNPQTHEKLIAQQEITTTTTTLAPTTNNAPYVFTTVPSLNVPACGSCKLPSTTPRPPGHIPGKLPFQTPAFQNKGPTKEKETVDTFRKSVEAIDNNREPPNYGTEELIDRRYGNGELNEFGDILPENYEPIKPSVDQQPPHFENPTRNDVISNIPNTRTGKQFDVPEKLQEDPNNPILPGNQDVAPRYNPDINQDKPVEPFKPSIPTTVSNQDIVPRYNPDTFQEKAVEPFKPSNPITVSNQDIAPRYNPDTFQEKAVETFKPSIPITVSNQQINIPGRDPIPIKDPYPNMVDGLPSGITENDMLDLLYKFNYTLGFHGHHEKGLKNGAKVGAYFVNGRDGISRVVEYIADENGYRPKVKFINLGYDSPDTPKEDTEKTFGLKGYEFTWYPI